MKKNIKYLTSFFLILMFLIINTLKAQEIKSYSILLTGNTSEGLYSNEILNRWNETLNATDSLAILMLGNVYNPVKNGFLDNFLSNNRFSVLLAPGENEWAKGKISGQETLEKIQSEIRNLYKGKTFIPDAACPVPMEVVLNEHLVVILIDTYWWVHKYERKFTECDINSNADVLVKIEDAIRRHYNTKHVVIAGHHSIKSYGNSDGFFSLKQEIFEAPYTLYRKTLGTRKDNHHPDFKEFRNAMKTILSQYPDVIYVSAGDENLQYFKLNQNHHIVSGSLIKSKYVNSKKTEFASSENGFAQLKFYNNGNCELDFISAEGILFSETIYNKVFNDTLNINEKTTLFQDSITIQASNKYNISKSKYLWMGKNYRDIWNTPIKVPVFNIGTQNGGLQIVKRGGMQQTFSIRLEDNKGNQYVLRSIEKYVQGALPKELENTFTVDIVQDLVSASNPYASVVVAELSKSLRIYHTNPKIVYVPDDSRFGIYQKDVANRLFTFEVHPSGNKEDFSNFGNSDKVISTKKLIEKLLDKKNNFIDTDAIIRARLFDILINDWDRHDDQWRWARFKVDGVNLYKPIPRDRDQAFFVNEGIIPWITKQKILLPKIQGFDDYTENVEGHGFNARFFDRTFLSQSEWKDWKHQIDSIKILLTPSKIDKAVLSFPKEVQPLCANRTAEILKKRLDNLEPMAKELYLFLSKEVSVIGTNDRNLFEISIPNDSIVTLKVFLFDKKNNKKEIFKRRFYASETKKIRIYGLDEKDIFRIIGGSKNKINISIIGGDDNDEIIYEENKSPNFLTIYDKNSPNISQSLKTQIKNIYDEDELKYDRKSFEYNIIYPGLITGYNRDDGLFIGGGPIIKRYSRYRRHEYQVKTNYAFASNAINYYFSGKTYFPLKHFDLGYITDIKSSSFINYFGMGNETKWLVPKSNKDYYRVEKEEYLASIKFTKYLNNKETHKIGFGIFNKKADVDTSSGKFISDFSQNGIDINSLESHFYTGLFLSYKFDNLSKNNVKVENQFSGSNMFHTRGTKIETKVSRFIGINNISNSFTKISGEWISYLSFSERPRFVYTFRVGGNKILGDYFFTEAIKLGQDENLRGFRSSRFYGDASLYLNTEIRIRVKDFKSYVLNGTAGLLIFNDVGRVWFDGENSTMWHDGFGFGLWWSPFDMALLTLTNARSNDDNLINFSINYQF